MRLLICALAFMYPSLVTSQEIEVQNLVFDPGQAVFQIGNRPQRIRYFLSSDTNKDRYIEGSPQLQKMETDPIRLSQNQFPSQKWNQYIAVGASPDMVNRGLSQIMPDWRFEHVLNFTGKSRGYGIIVNPGLMICATEMLKLVKRVGDTLPGVFDQLAIDEVNIYLKPVLYEEEVSYGVQVTPVYQLPKDPALSFLIPFCVPRGICGLPTEAKLEEAIIRAAQESSCCF